MDTFPDLTVHRQQAEKLCFDENTRANYKLCVCDVKMSGLFEMEKNHNRWLILQVAHRGRPGSQMIYCVNHSFTIIFMMCWSPSFLGETL